MTWAPTETQQAIWATLASDDALIDLLGEDSGTVDVSTKVLDFVPDNTDYPYVRLSIKPWRDRGNHKYEGLEAEVTINVFYQPGENNNNRRGDLAVQLIQKRIDELLHNNRIDIDGWNTLQLRRTFVDIIDEDDNVTKNGVQQFLIYLGGN